MLTLDCLTFMGALVGAMAYEATTLLGYICVHALIVSRYNATSQQSRRSFLLSLTFVIVVFLLGTVSFFAQAATFLEAFVIDRSFPLGPTAFISFSAADMASQIANICSIVTPWLSDGYLLWRVYALWNKNYKVVLLPGALYIGAMAMSIATLYANYDITLDPNTSVAIGLTYFGMNIGVNVILSALIVGKLLHANYVTKRAFRSPGRSVYTSIAAIIIESSLPYTAVFTVFAIVTSQDTDASQMLFPLASQITCISPLLIMWRVTARKNKSCQSELLPLPRVRPSQVPVKDSIHSSTNSVKFTRNVSTSIPGSEDNIVPLTGRFARSDSYMSTPSSLEKRPDRF